ncbi:hypothetical protein GCM10007304_24760 [Rhodococcoides trifolii]|uniref:Uncharacterized protein n=1 Tax=Rhodococcoides trifolii TaxID=908250 RepID=A0A917D5L8_9NOCA|nr:hypothetical protein GCM10007304_24760 [Rhodococcus trifolii]
MLSEIPSLSARDTAAASPSTSAAGAETESSCTSEITSATFTPAGITADNGVAAALGKARNGVDIVHPWCEAGR